MPGKIYIRRLLLSSREPLKPYSPPLNIISLKEQIFIYVVIIYSNTFFKKNQNKLFFLTRKGNYL